MYKVRGSIQLTAKANYKRARQMIGAARPTAGIPGHSKDCPSRSDPGMKEGYFTGVELKTLSDWPVESRY
jgi:predicted chitinase